VKLVYDFDSGEGTVWSGELGWENQHHVIQGRLPTILLSKGEQAWLRACWSGAGRAAGGGAAPEHSWTGVMPGR
jgi:hypothetical protein